MSNPTFCTNKALALLGPARLRRRRHGYSAQRLYDASHILVGRATTQSYRALLAMAGDHDTACRLFPGHRHATAPLPGGAGIVACNKALLRNHFPSTMPT